MEDDQNVEGPFLQATDDVKVGTGKGESHEEMESQRRPRRGTSLGVDGRVIGQNEGQTWSKAEAEDGQKW